MVKTYQWQQQQLHASRAQMSGMVRCHMDDSGAPHDQRLHAATDRRSNADMNAQV